VQDTAETVAEIGQSFSVALEPCACRMPVRPFFKPRAVNESDGIAAASAILRG